MTGSIPAEFGFAFAALPFSLLFTRIMITLAQKRQWVARPKADRWHQKPTALYGGVAMAFAFFLGCIPLLFTNSLWKQFDVVGLLLGCLTIFLVGLKDDVKALNPLVKLLGQVMSVTPFLVGLLLAHSSLTLILSLPVLFIWMVILTNSFNLLDNMDGLSAGTSAIIGSVLAVFAALHGLWNFSMLSVLIALSAVGFLWFNFRPKEGAKIFMGDCGSMLLGYTLSGLSVLSVLALPLKFNTTFLFPLLLMALPIFDTTLVIICRKKEGRAISQGGKDHASHRLVYAGKSEKQAVGWLYLLSFVAGGAGILSEIIGNIWLGMVFGVIAFFGLIRLGNYLDNQTYVKAGLSVLRTILDEPYLSTDPNHQGLLLHSVYHQPNGWDHVPQGRKVACGESCMWGDYHLREAALLVERMAKGKPYLKFWP